MPRKQTAQPYHLFVLMLAMILATTAVSKELTPIKVGIDLWPGYYPVVIAKEKGWFRENGLAVEYFLPENTDKMLQDFVNGETQVICVALGDVFALTEKLPGLRVPMISDESAGGDALISLKPLPDSLKGLKIGTNLNGFGELFVTEFLRQHNTNPKDIILVHQEASRASHLLSTGKVDIAHSWEPYVSEASAYYNAQVVFSSAATPGLIPDAVVFHPDLIAQPAAAKAFVKTWLKAAEWWLGHRHDGNRIAERNLLLMPNTVNLEGIKLMTTEGNRTLFAAPEEITSLYQVTSLYIDFFRSKGVITKPLAAKDVITPEFLP
ncbi:MAG: ABC transporter substrate-binding protein [Pseudomonadota bacterium]|nr:ABC transporter substrate-binding protein [Pseudomonadota bacterium]